MQSLQCIKPQQYMETQDTLVGKARYCAAEKAQTHTRHTKSLNSTLPETTGSVRTPLQQ